MLTVKYFKTLTILVSSLILTGCSHPFYVTKPYALWGKAYYLPSDNSQSDTMVQISDSSNYNDLSGCILIVHGMNEHSGRYDEIANHFSNKFLVAALDMTAHGLSNPVLYQAHHHIKNGGTEFDAGDAYLDQSQLDSLEPMRHDLELALEFFVPYCEKKLNRSDVPVYILSHSLGSLVSVSYLQQSSASTVQKKIQGIILSGPAFAVTEVPGWRGWFQNPLIWFTFHTHQHFLHPHDEALPILLLNQILALVTVPLQDGIVHFASLPGIRTVFAQTGPSWVGEHLTNSKEELLKLSQDDYLVRRCILNFVLAVEKEIIAFRRNMQDFKVPYLLVYSEHDPITPAWGNEDFINATIHNHKDNHVMVLSGESHHEQLFSESKLQSEILNSIDNWLSMRVNTIGIEPISTNQALQQ